ncbi:MAG: hypothetical protein AAFV90_23170 [Cyanobacteria bacterium J06634_5]
MSRLFDLEKSVQRVRAKHGLKTDNHSLPKTSSSRISGARQHLSGKLYASQLGTTTETHYGTITHLYPDDRKGYDPKQEKHMGKIIEGGLIKDANGKNIKFTVKDNLIGFAGHFDDQKTLDDFIIKMSLNGFLKRNMRVQYQVDAYPNGTIKGNTVKGITLDLMGKHDTAETFETKYIVELNPDTISHGRIKWDNTKNRWLRNNIPKVTRDEWQPNNSEASKLKMVLKRSDYPHISGVALRRYETAEAGLDTADQAEKAMEIVRLGSQYIVLKSEDLPDLIGLHLTPGGRFITAINTGGPRSLLWDKYWRSISKSKAVDIPQHDPRHVGTHPPQMYLQGSHQHWAYQTSDGPSSALEWNAQRFGQLIAGLQALKYTVRKKGPNKGKSVPYVSQTLNGQTLWSRRTEKLPTSLKK